MLRKIMSITLSAALLLSAAITASAESTQVLGDDMLVSFSAEESESYEAYKKALKDCAFAKEEIAVSVAGGAVLLSEGKSVSFDVNIPSDAVYQIKLTYKTADESTQNPSCAIRIDGA